MAEKVALQGVPETLLWPLIAFGFLIPLLSHLPMPAFIANKRPAFVVVRFGEGAAKI